MSTSDTRRDERIAAAVDAVDERIADLEADLLFCDTEAEGRVIAERMTAARRERKLLEYGIE